MLKLIIQVPRSVGYDGFDAETFCNAATSMARDLPSEWQHCDYDYDLGDYVRSGSGVSLDEEDGYAEVWDFITYAVNAYWVDMAHVEAMEKLRKICPQVEFFFESSGGGKNEEQEGFFSVGDYIYELLRPLSPCEL